MKKTAVEWLYNNLKSHFEHDGDLLEIVQMSFEQAKEMEKNEKLKNQLFIGKVSEIIGWSKVIELMKECNKTFKSEQ